MFDNWQCYKSVTHVCHRDGLHQERKKLVMKTRNIKTSTTLLLIIFVLSLFSSVPYAYAATTPGLGQAATFAILSSTYTNTVGGTTINGDLGYTTGPAMAPTVNGTTHAADGTYTQAGTDQGAALVALNAQPCTHTFPAGAVDLATDISHGPIGVYTPGVYCTTASSAASIGSGGITLSGSGTYIFRIDGALTTVANSMVTSAGASACDVFWTPAAATTLGANSTFFGTDIDDSGVTIGSTVTWTGRALAFGGTVSTDVDTITAPTCTASPSPSAVATSSGGSSSSSSGSGGGGSSGPACPPLNSTIVAPIIIESRRVSPTSIFVSWGPYSGTDTFNVRYGFTNGDWLYNTDVTGFSTTINALPTNQPIWIQVAARNSCAVGTYGAPKLVGGPRLPNTGFAPHGNSIEWYISTINFVLLFLLLKLKHA